MESEHSPHNEYVQDDDAVIALNFQQLTKPSALPPCRAFAGIVASSVAREATDRGYQIGFHCHIVPQNPCPTLRQSGAAHSQHEQSCPDISAGRKHKSKPPTPAMKPHYAIILARREDEDNWNTNQSDKRERIKLRSRQESKFVARKITIGNIESLHARVHTWFSQ